MYIRANAAMTRREGIESPSCAVRTMQQPGLGRLRGHRSLGLWPFDTAWFQNIQGQMSAKTYDPSVLWMPQQPTIIPTATANGAPAVPTDSGTSLIVPGSSVSDVLLNAMTGKATTTQIQSNIDSCVANIQRMRQVSAAAGLPGPPAGVEQQCTTDQAPFLANAVSWQNLLQNISIPSPVSNLGLWVALGIGGLLALYVWSRR